MSSLKDLPSIASALFVKFVITENGVAVTSTYSDYFKPILLQGDEYTGLGQLMAITDTQSELRTTGQEVTISLSGIPSENIIKFSRQNIKGGLVTVKRGLFDSRTGVILSLGTGLNPIGRFSGIINNYSIDEVWNEGSRSSTAVINIICNSQTTALSRKLSGRFTSPANQRALFPTDASMDRVPNIAGANFNFGAPEK